MDIIQDILSLSRNVGKSYKKASPQLKRLYLGLFWERFKSENRRVVEAKKASIVLALEQVGLIKSKAKQKSVQSKRTSTNSNIPVKEVILSSKWGDQRESNPHQWYHKPPC